MKKLILSCLVAFTLMSCMGPRGPQGPQGSPGANGEGANWKIISLTVRSSDWIEDFDNGNRYYTARFTTPEITNFVYNEGLVLCYAIVNNSQITLPYVRHYQQGGNFWTRTVDFDYGVGGVNIYVTNSDFVSDPPEEMKFSLKLLW